MLHLIYILAFTILAFLAVGNLIRNLMTLGLDSQRGYGSPNRDLEGNRSVATVAGRLNVPHPELLDETGNIVKEPYLVIRSMSVEDAREQLDALYKSSPGGNTDNSPEEA